MRHHNQLCMSSLNILGFFLLLFFSLQDFFLLQKEKKKHFCKWSLIWYINHFSGQAPRPATACLEIGDQNKNSMIIVFFLFFKCNIDLPLRHFGSCILCFSGFVFIVLSFEREKKKNIKLDGVEEVRIWEEFMEENCD